MISGVESSTHTDDSSTDLLEIGHGQEQEKDPREHVFSANEVTHQSFKALIKLVTEPILKQVKKLCALLFEWNELDVPGNNKASVSEFDVTPASSVDNRCYRSE